MIFKNLSAYRITGTGLDSAVLEKALSNKQAYACSSQQQSTFGFVSPRLKPDAELAHVSGHFILICGQKEERILPPAVICDAVKEKVDELEAAQARKVYTKERGQIREEVLMDLMPRAFVRKSHTFAAIDLKQQIIFVNTASSKAAEELLSTLREALGSLPARPVSVKTAPCATFTSWIQENQVSHSFHLTNECIMRDISNDGPVIKAIREDLGSEEIQNHLHTGKIVTQLGLAYEDKLSFVIDDSLVIRKLQFADLLDQSVKDAGEDEESFFDSSFNLMMLTLAEFYPKLIEAMGGEELPQNI